MRGFVVNYDLPTRCPQNHFIRPSFSKFTTSHNVIKVKDELLIQSSVTSDDGVGHSFQFQNFDQAIGIIWGDQDIFDG